MAKLEKLMALAIMSETTQNTAVDAGGTATNFIPLMDKPSYSISNEKLQRHVQREAMGTLAHVSGMTECEINFKLEMLSTGTANSAYAPLQAALKACGHTVSGGTAGTDWTYALGTSAITNMLGNAVSVTIDFYIDGFKHQIYGAVGTYKAVLEAGKVPYFDFSFKGLYTAVSDTAIPTTTFTHAAPPLMQSGAFKIDNTSFTAEKVEFDIANKIERVTDVSAAAAGNGGYRIVDRSPKVSVSPEMTTVAVYNFMSKYVASTALNTSSVGVSVATGSTAKNYLTFTAINAQIAAIKESSRAGIATFDLDLQLNDSTENDAYTIIVDNAAS